MGVGGLRVCGVSVWACALGPGQLARFLIFGMVLGEDGGSAPNSSAVDAVRAVAVPAIVAFEGVDSAFGADSPFDQPADRPVMCDAGLAVAVVDGNRPVWLACAGDAPLDRRQQLRRVRRHTDLRSVVQRDTVGVVHPP